MISRQTNDSDTPSSSPSRSHRRKPLLQKNQSSHSPCGGSTPAEFFGGTTASCAAVWCCCPCGLVNLFVLAIYKVPRGICRRAIRNRRHKRRVKNPQLPTEDKKERMQRVFENSEFAIHPFDSDNISSNKGDDDDNFMNLKLIGKSSASEEEETDDEDDKAVLALEKEMWDTFSSAGFWRSPSQRESISSPRVSTSLLLSPRPESD